MRRIHQAVIVYLTALHEQKIRESSIKLRIVQEITGKGYLVSDGDRMVLVETPPGNYADDDEIEWVIEPKGETFAYTAVSGAKKTVHVFRPVPLPELPNLSEFIKQLKAGKTFVIIKGERDERCPDCGGFGKGRLVDGTYVPCRCRDVGIWKLPNYYTISW